MEPHDRQALRSVHRMRRHVLVFAGVNTGLLIADLLLPGPVWFIYPLIFWGAALAMHVFYVRALYLDPGWADRRTERVRRLSYDHGHIAQIETAPRGASNLATDLDDAPGAATDEGGERPCRQKT